MTNEDLKEYLKKANIKDGKVVRCVDNLKAVLISFPLEHPYVFKRDPNLTEHNEYEFLILVCNGKKAGIIFNMSPVDIHIYMRKKYRKQHIASRLIGNGFLKKLCPNIETCTCLSYFYYDEVESLVTNAGYQLYPSKELINDIVKRYLEEDPEYIRDLIKASNLHKTEEYK